MEEVGVIKLIVLLLCFFFPIKSMIHISGNQCDWFVGGLVGLCLPVLSRNLI